jgi:prophage maintenance system killer protein
MGKKEKIYRLNINRIADALTQVQQEFPGINDQLSVRREDLTDDMIQNLLSAYQYLDKLVIRGVNIFEKDHLFHLLELNHTVLCGRDPVVRMEYGPHIEATRQKFSQLINPVRKWYKKHDSSSAMKVASAIYVGILSRPQLFIEGNHRTGSIAASWVLLTNKKYPFVLNVDNAVSYFEPSSEIKFSDKRSIKGKMKLPKYQKSFKRFLEAQVSPDYVLNPDD